MLGHLVVRLMGWACLVGLTLACFGPALDDAHQLAYRDYSDFYYPLYQRVQQEWDAGRLPTWSPEENGGSPMLGNPTSAVLYPGKLIYAALPYPRAAKAYVVAHVLLAFVAMVALLRRSGVSGPGSALGGLAYAFGAPVLTQYSNVVFLVGASWMPLGLRFADGWVRLGRPRELAGLAWVMAMQVLGGDPEAAYLTALASAAFAVGRWVMGEPSGRRGRIALTVVGLILAYAGLLGLEVWGLRARAGPVAVGEPRSWWPIAPSSASLAAWSVAGLMIVVRWWSRRGRQGLEGRLLGIFLAGLLALALSGAQLVPTLEFIARTTRADGGVDLYPQSIHPARMVEWAWPNAFGPPFGLNRRWVSALPPTNDYTIWLTSVYLGGITTVLAFGATWSRHGPGPRGWFGAIAVVGLLASFGQFGSPLFWARAIPGASARLGALEEPESGVRRPDGRLRDGDGGPYWFLASALPGFRSFRYPGKLFVPVALGMAGLAGLGFDDLVAGRRRAVSALAWSLMAAGLACLAASAIAPDRLLQFLGTRAEMARSAFGPFDPAGAAADLRWAIAQGTAMMALAIVLGRLAPARPLLAGVIALVGMSADLAWANRGHVGIVPQSAYEAGPRVLAAIRQSERDHPEPGPFRVYRLRNWAPPRWDLEGSPDRLEQIVRWERDSLRDKYGLPDRVDSTYAYGTAELSDPARFFEPWVVEADAEAARRLGVEPGHRVVYYPRRGFDLWNTRYFVVPTRLAPGSYFRGFAAFRDGTQAIYPDLGPGDAADRGERLRRWSRDEDVQVLRNKNAYPRAWVVHRVIPVDETTGREWLVGDRLMAALLYQDDELWHVEGRGVLDPRRVAWVEAPASKLAGLAGAAGGSEPVRVTTGDDPTRVELEVTLQSPGLVILADVFYPGWRLEVDGRAAEILRVNRAMRGAVVPAGPHRLVYRYRPDSVVAGAVLSALGLLATACVLIRGRPLERSGSEPR